MGKGKEKARSLVCFPASVDDELVNFAVAQVRAERTDGKHDPLPAGWLVRKLILDGSVGYWHSGNEDTDGFYNIRKMSTKTRYGLASVYTLRTDASGAGEFAVPAYDGEKGAVMIRANSGAVPPYIGIKRCANLIRNVDVALSANVIASMRSQILGGADKNTLDLILEDMYSGLPTFITTELLDTLKSVDISVPFIGNDLQALRQTLYSDALKHCGGIASVQYKAERVQGAEVEAHVAEAIDYVYILIDQANEDMKSGNVPYKLTYRGYGAIFDEDVPDETSGNDEGEEERNDENEGN